MDEGPPAWGMGMGLTILHCKKYVTNIKKNLKPGWIHWINDPSGRIWI
jgi:hypothetical protein